MRRSFHRTFGRWLLLLPTLWLAGCQTPDLKPFATASATLATAIKQGGDLATNTLIADPMLVDGKVIQPEDNRHPAQELRREWQERRKSAEALLVYSAGLAAIGDASAKRKENATQLVDAVEQLARSVPGVGIGIGSAGDVTVKVLEKGVEVFVEIKAWHDMAKAVRAADPAIQKIAVVLMEDFASLNNAYLPKMNDKINKTVFELGEPEWVWTKLTTARNAQRAKVAEAPGDKELGAELARVDALVAGVEPEVTAKRAGLARLLAEKEHGRQLFTAAGEAVEAWAKAHADIAAAFEEKRLPNLVLLQARAQEIAELVEEIKVLRHSSP